MGGPWRFSKRQLHIQKEASAPESQSTVSRLPTFSHFLPSFGWRRELITTMARVKRIPFLALFFVSAVEFPRGPSANRLCACNRSGTCARPLVETEPSTISPRVDKQFDPVLKGFSENYRCMLPSRAGETPVVLHRKLHRLTASFETPGHP